MKVPAGSLGSSVSDGSVRRLAARTPIHVPWDCLWTSQTCPWASWRAKPALHFHPWSACEPERQNPIPSSLANFHGPKWPALPPFLTDRILDPPDTFLQEFSLAGALQPPQTSFLPEPSKRLLSPGLTWTLDSPCSVSWVIFLYLVFRIALKGNNCLWSSHFRGQGHPNVLCVYFPWVCLV